MTNYYSLLATTMGEMSLNKFLQLSNNIQSYPELRPLWIMLDRIGIDMENVLGKQLWRVFNV